MNKPGSRLSLAARLVVVAFYAVFLTGAGALVVAFVGGALWSWRHLY